MRPDPQRPGLRSRAAYSAEQKAALQQVSHGIGRQAGLRGHCGGGVILRSRFRRIADFARANCPTRRAHCRTCRIRPCDEVVALETDAYQRNEIVRIEPDGETALIDGLSSTLPMRMHRTPMPYLCGVHGAERLAESLAHAVARIRQRQRVDPDLPRARIEAHHMVRGCENDAPHAGEPRGLEHIVAPTILACRIVSHGPSTE